MIRGKEEKEKREKKKELPVARRPLPNTPTIDGTPQLRPAWSKLQVPVTLPGDDCLLLIIPTVDRDSVSQSCERRTGHGFRRGDERHGACRACPCRYHAEPASPRPWRCTSGGDRGGSSWCLRAPLATQQGLLPSAIVGPQPYQNLSVPGAGIPR